MLSKPLIHQSQPTPMGCVCTCVAMLAGVPANEVIDVWHDLYFNKQKVELHDILLSYGIQAKQQLAGNSQMLFSGCVYILTVASLNIRGGLHQVVLDYRDTKPIVYDPAKGYGNGSRLYYTTDLDEVSEVEQAVELISWITDYIIEVPDAIKLPEHEEVCP